ncbi:MAG: hypothetical protein P1P89_13310 [Desulfobacterales bacterium]|nr:hypothetical protein [Desulfobacterales bacterium]
MKIAIKVPRVTAPEDPTPPVAYSDRPKQVVGLRLGFLDNTKPNADRFLQQLAGRLQDHYKLSSVLHRRKHDSSSPAGQSLLDELQRECDAVINAVPD